MKAKGAKLWVYRRFHLDHDCQAAEIDMTDYFAFSGSSPAGLIIQTR